MLRIAFTLLGVAAILIGSSIFLAGPDWTGQMFVLALRAVAPETPTLEGLHHANVDSELRFYAALWFAYGALALWVARDLPERVQWLRIMLAVFLLGGVGRAISWVAVGAPHPLFQLLMLIEIALPPALIALSYNTARGRP
jgi:hypothetical protein